MQDILINWAPQETRVAVVENDAGLNELQRLKSLGVIGVGFVAIPIMTAGAAYDLGQALGHALRFFRR